MKVRYSLTRPDMNNLKGIISETLINNYIKEVVIPRLMDKWDYVFFLKSLLHSFTSRNRVFNSASGNMYLISRGLFPNIELRKKMKILEEILINEPDGYILKLRDTSNKIILKEALDELSLSGYLKGSWKHGEDNIFVGEEHNENEELPIVDGEIEIVEVKSDKGKLVFWQKEQYGEAIQKGIPLRYFHVNILSFINNEYEITEKLVLNNEKCSI